MSMKKAVKKTKNVLVISVEVLDHRHEVLALGQGGEALGELSRPLGSRGASSLRSVRSALRA